MPKKRKRLSGGAKLKAAGKHAIMLGVRQADYKLLKAAADMTMRPVSQFVVFHALAAADAVIAGGEK